MSSAVEFYLRLKRRPFAELHPEFRKFIPDGPIFVTGPKGHDLLVEFLTYRGRAYFGAGWVQFFQRNEIDYGDILLCRLSPQRRTMAVKICSQSADTEMFSSKIPKTSEARRSEAGNDHSNEDPKKIRNQGKQEKDLQQFRKSLSHPNFQLTLTTSRLTAACNIPAAYVHYLPEPGAKFTLIGPDGHKTKVKRYLNEFASSISRGWSAFTKRYPLKVGDKIVFEILSPSLWKVHIFS